MGRVCSAKKKKKLTEWGDVKIGVRSQKVLFIRGKAFNGKEREKSFLLLFVTPTHVASIHEPLGHDCA